MDILEITDFIERLHALPIGEQTIECRCGLGFLEGDLSIAVGIEFCYAGVFGSGIDKHDMIERRLKAFVG